MNFGNSKLFNGNFRRSLKSEHVKVSEKLLTETLSQQRKEKVKNGNLRKLQTLFPCAQNSSTFEYRSHELLRWSSFSFLILTFSGFNYRTKISIEYITTIYMKSKKQYKVISNFLNLTIDSCRKRNFHMGDCMSRGESEFYSAFH